MRCCTRDNWRHIASVYQQALQSLAPWRHINWEFVFHCYLQRCAHDASTIGGGTISQGLEEGASRSTSTSSSSSSSLPPLPRLVVSACLLGLPVSYRGAAAPEGVPGSAAHFLRTLVRDSWARQSAGGSNTNDNHEQVLLRPMFSVLPICPEVDLLGLGSPRPPVFLRRRLGSSCDHVNSRRGEAGQDMIDLCFNHTPSPSSSTSSSLLTEQSHDKRSLLYTLKPSTTLRDFLKDDTKNMIAPVHPEGPEMADGLIEPAVKTTHGNPMSGAGACLRCAHANKPLIHEKNGVHLKSVCASPPSGPSSASSSRSMLLRRALMGDVDGGLVHGAVLKARSPSCGVGDARLYALSSSLMSHKEATTARRSFQRVDGFFTQLLRREMSWSPSSSAPASLSSYILPRAGSALFDQVPSHHLCTNRIVGFPITSEKQIRHYLGDANDDASREVGSPTPPAVVEEERIGGTVLDFLRRVGRYYQAVMP